MRWLQVSLVVFAWLTHTPRARVVAMCHRRVIHRALQNMKRVAKELGEELGDDEMQAMIEEFDRDQDGEINEQEFAYIMKQTSIY